MIRIASVYGPIIPAYEKQTIHADFKWMYLQLLVAMNSDEQAVHTRHIESSAFPDVGKMRAANP